MATIKVEYIPFGRNFRKRIAIDVLCPTKGLADEWFKSVSEDYDNGVIGRDEIALAIAVYNRYEKSPEGHMVGESWGGFYKKVRNEYRKI